MRTENPLLITSVEAQQETDPFFFVGFDGALLNSAVKALGVSNANTPSGEELPVTTHGIALIWSGAAVSAGDEVESDANAKAVPVNAGVRNGWSLDDAAGANELIRIRLV